MKDPIEVHEVARVAGIAIGVSPDLKRRGARGWAMRPKNGRKTKLVVVSSHLPPNGPMFMEAVIHEMLHLQNPSWSEAKVVKHSHQLATVLRKIGYRLQTG